jgi:phosphoribosylformimino-5-aminoimidazole carboxamide ribotide isomerase
MNRWQTVTNLRVDEESIRHLSSYCDELLVHAVDVEGKCEGIDSELVGCLSDWSPIPVTYAGGARHLNDLQLIDRISLGKVDVTVGSALDIFGGKGLLYSDCVSFNHRLES